MDEGLARELTRMAEEDQRVRAELAREGHLFRGYHPRMAEVNSRHAERLQEIIEAGTPDDLEAAGRRLAETL